MRAPLGNAAYWDGRVARYEKLLTDDNATLKRPSPNQTYQPTFWFEHSIYCMRLMLTKYSRGDRIDSMTQYLESLIVAWERSNHCSASLSIADGLPPPRAALDLSNLNFYNLCLWLVGLALSLEIPDEQWIRLLALIDNEGQDILLDRIIATRQPSRRIGKKLLHAKPYERLLLAIDGPSRNQPALLRDFVEHWYSELRRKRSEQLWWYVYGDPVIHPLEMGGYFGRWCVEAVAAVKAFGIDDRLCLGHEHYPGDLLRPNGPATHVVRPDSAPSRRFAWRLPKLRPLFQNPSPLRSYFGRLLHR